MKQTVLLLCVFFSIQLLAQPVIPPSSVPTDGDSWLQLVTGATPDPGPAGANQNWNFEDVELMGDVLEFRFQDPANTPYAATYPGATVAAQFVFNGSEEDFYGYYQAQGDLFSALGESSPFSVTTYSDPQSFRYLNLTFGNSVSDAYASTTTTMSSTSSGSGMTIYDYDAYGNITLPNGTVNGVARIHQLDYSTDTLDLGFGISSILLDTLETFAWVHPSSIFPVATWQRVSGLSVTIVNGMVIEQTRTDPIVTFNFNFTGMSNTETVAALDEEVKAFYDPQSRQLQVEFGSDQDNVNFVIYANNGKKILQQNSGAGSNRFFSIDLPYSITPGIYYLVINDSTMKKFMVSIE